MNSLNSDVDLLFSRVQHLEAQNRSLKRVMIAAALAALALITMGQAASSGAPRVLEAEEFVLKDQAGHRRAVLAADKAPGETVLALYDKTGNLGAAFTASSKSVTGFVLYGPDAKKRVQLGTVPGLGTQLAFTPGDENPHLALTLMPDGMAALTLRGKDTEHGADLSVTADGTPNFTLTDPTGKELFSKP